MFYINIVDQEFAFDRMPTARINRDVSKKIRSRVNPHIRTEFLRAPPPSSHEEITIFRGTLMAEFDKTMIY